MTDLFDPFDLAGLNLTNRMIMAPMTCTRADDAGVPTDPMREYYMQRASAGLIVTECTDVRPDSAGIMHAPGAYNAAQEAGWRKITDAVHAAGGRIYLQVWHGGRISHPSLQPDGAPPIAPFAIAADVIAFESIDATNEWRFKPNDTIRVAPRLTVNIADAAIAAAEAGIGITRTLSYQVRDSVMAGRLLPILQKFAPPPSPVSAIYPARRIVSANVAAFIKIARNHFVASPLVPVQNWRVQGVD